MTVNRTTLLDLPLPVTGTESGTWGDTTNNGLTQYMDIAIAGMSNLTSANFTTGALTIETTEGNSTGTNISATSAQYAGFRVTSLAQNSTITVGNTGTNPARSYRLINADATYTLTFKATGQTGITLQPGQTAVVAFNGTDYVIVGMAGAGTVTDNAVVRFDGTTGKLVQNSVVTIADTTGDVAGVGALTASGNLTLSGGTANGVLYLNGSKVATSGSAVTYNGTTFATSADASISGLTVGKGAGAVSTNTAVGASALAANTSGAENTAFGNSALTTNTSGASNVAVGSLALGFANTNTGSGHVAIGSSALRSNSSGTANTAVGGGVPGVAAAALQTNTTGSYNTALGNGALGSNTTASNNTAVGYQAGYTNTTGTGVVALGNAALYSNTTGNQNVALGNQALLDNTTGSDNVAIGAFALENNTTANYNVAVGRQALYSNTTASNNTAVGYQAGYSNTTGTLDAFGDSALRSCTTGVFNSAFGRNAAYSTSTGSYNTAMGTGGVGTYAALQSNTTGGYNTAFGVSALGQNTTASNNTAVGYQAGDVITTGARNTIIGDGSDPSANNGNDQTVVGQGLTGKGDDTAFIGGTNGAYNEKNVTTWETTSDERIKKNIVDNTVGLEKIKQIRIRNFEYRKPEEITELPDHAAINKDGVQLGVIAQEIQQVLPECVTENSTGVLSVSTDPLVWHLINAVKQLSAEVESLKSQLKGN